MTTIRSDTCSAHSTTCRPSSARPRMRALACSYTSPDRHLQARAPLVGVPGLVAALVAGRDADDAVRSDGGTELVEEPHHRDLVRLQLHDLAEQCGALLAGDRGDVAVDQGVELW